jgi:hypothetical protein
MMGAMWYARVWLSFDLNGKLLRFMGAGVVEIDHRSMLFGPSLSISRQTPQSKFVVLNRALNIGHKAPTVHKAPAVGTRPLSTWNDLSSQTYLFVVEGISKRLDINRCFFCLARWNPTIHAVVSVTVPALPFALGTEIGTEIEISLSA